MDAVWLALLCLMATVLVTTVAGWRVRSRRRLLQRLDRLTEQFEIDGESR